MNHITYEAWSAYAHDKLDEATCDSYETHLYQCDVCLETYMKVIETIEMKNPTVSTEDIMKQVYPVESPLTDKTHGYKKTLLHYSIAVAMTFLLMSTGVFTQLTHLDIEKDDSEKPSIVTKLLNSPFSIIDKFKERE